MDASGNDGVRTGQDVIEQMSTGSVRVHVRLNKRVHDELKMLGDHEGRSVSDIVRQIINAHLRNNEDIISRMKE